VAKKKWSFRTRAAAYIFDNDVSNNEIVKLLGMRLKRAPEEEVSRT